MRTEEDHIACMGKMAHNAISESNHAQATTDLISGVKVTFYSLMKYLYLHYLEPI
jgi:hypothetical protein